MPTGDISISTLRILAVYAFVSKAERQNLLLVLNNLAELDAESALTVIRAVCVVLAGPDWDDIPAGVSEPAGHGDWSGLDDVETELMIREHEAKAAHP